MNEHDELHNHEAEVALLSACLWSKNARIEARRVVLSSDFYEPWHETIYDAMVSLDRHGKNIDPVTLRAALAANPGRAPQGLDAVLVEVTSAGGLAESVRDYAAIVRRWALRRTLAEEGRRIAQQAMDPASAPDLLAARTVTRLTSIRDQGTGDVTAERLDDVMRGKDETPSWVIPNLFERGDRLMLTGTEGSGKSALSRQIAIMAAAGLHPFTQGIMPPIRSLIIDAENKMTQVRRQTRPLVDWLERNGADSPLERVMIDALYPQRVNLLSDRDLSRLHQLLDAWQPDLIVIGPIYRMSPRALQTDDEAHPFLAALDTLAERGCAMIVEAHAGHAAEQQRGGPTRSLRPRGSSALMGWPEFGLGLRPEGHGLATLESWRGHREQRAWPTKVKHAAGNRWVEAHPDERPQEPPRVIQDPQAIIDF